jgi:DNA-binding NarL/FixJ family response regulator
LYNFIMIIDEDRRFCDAFTTLIATTNFRISAVCPDVTVAIARIGGERAPDIVLADLGAADTAALRRLRADRPMLRIGILGDPSDEDARTLLRDVAPHAILAKSMPAEAMVAALSLMLLDVCVLARRHVVGLPTPSQPSIARGGMATALQATTTIDGLTAREREILRLLAGGDGNRRIADQLGITESTVKMHCKSLLRKLGVPNRTQAAVLAHRWGWANDPSGRDAGTSRRS